VPDFNDNKAFGEVKRRKIHAVVELTIFDGNEHFALPSSKIDQNF
jgi:hypothetical protein